MRNVSSMIAKLLVGTMLAASAGCIDSGGGEPEGDTQDPITSAQLTGPRTPVVVFPAFHFTKLTVTVSGQTVAPECPSSGSFEDWYQRPISYLTLWSQACRDKMMTMVYNPYVIPLPPMPERFSNQPGVSVTVKDYGRTESAPYYEPLYAFLEANGYVRNVNIRVAGYDSRLTPDLGDFLKRTKDLIQETYSANGNTPVHLVGHSNGPLYAQYLLTHTSQEWKNQYIHGFTPIAGNWPGQGLLYPVFFTGLNIRDFTFPTTVENAASSARMHRSAPASYMSAADPAVFGDQPVVVRDASTGVAYTPEDSQQLFLDAGLSKSAQIAAYYTGFVKFEPPDFPYVDVYAEKGSGIETVVGAQLPNLTPGLPLGNAPLFTRDGDGNQEITTNDAVRVWADMPCFRFSLTDNAGVNHFNLPRNLGLLNRLLAHLQQPRSVCPDVPAL